ncbi:YncE family protein [Ornithinimicrobium sediminis]|uniref:YncE family protein n=1 Tax=Ornithinimicrobium sediminis TaxID=2904603 RepID=UPI001E3F3222|nr:YncE family protein [Ornithinimicrobium sediminis]MCE0486361.1 YncE family protein [Ornithinimicrobium sediminis]
MQVRQEAVYRRRRRAVLGGLGLVLAGSLTACLATAGEDEPTPPAASSTAEDADVTADATAAAEDSGSGADEDSGSGADEDSGSGADEQAEAGGTTPEPPAVPSAQSQMERVDYITGGITPKSVVANGHGLVIANNMMYSHTATVYDTGSRELVATLDDAVDLADYGIEGHPGTSRGAPVEAAWTEDGRYAYVSQYTMYGQGFGVEGFDNCTPDSGVGASMLYRFDAEDMAWDQVIEVGAVPKYVDITPDQTRVLVSNWCDSTVSVVDIETAQETETIPIAAAPRGIDVMPDNTTAYVAAMYADKLFKVDLEAGTSEVAMDTPRKPRHLNLSDDGAYLYMAVSGSDTIYKIDTATDEIVDQVESGREPRSMILSSDGTALYVVNYYEPSVSKISTEDMQVLQKEPTDANPIGITYDPVTHTVWVACYGGSIYVFDDQAAAT